MKNNNNVDEYTEKKKLTIAYYRLSQEHFCSYKCLIEREDLHDIVGVKYFLISRALELVLKASLIRFGLKESVLKDYKMFGHDLNKLSTELLLHIEQSKEKFKTLLSLSDFDLRMIKKINKYYPKKDFEYFKPGVKRVPTPKDLENMVETLLNKLNEEINTVSF